MGYSIAIRCRTEALRQKMYTFLEKNLKDTMAIFPKHYGKNGYVSYRLCTPDGSDSRMSYDHAKSGLGFDYSCMPDVERHYIYSVVRWMAIKIGRKRHFKDIGTQYFYVYDGYDSWPIITNGTELKDYKWACTDELGYKEPWLSAPSATAKFLIKILGKSYSKTVKKELKRLDDLWQKEIDNVQKDTSRDEG